MTTQYSDGYQGLGEYVKPRVDPTAQRPGESDEAHRRRIAPYLRHSAEIEEQTWAAHRARVEAPVGQGSGLFERATPQERAQALGSPGLAFSGDQRIAKEGHLTATISVPGSVAIARVSLAAVEQRERQQRQAPRPIQADELRSSGTGWFTR
jgi:hypothetical protein